MHRKGLYRTGLMSFTPNIETITVRLAQNSEEVEAAQHLRYKVFYEEHKAIPSDEMARIRRDFDSYDAIADHLIVIDESITDPQHRIVGTYRLLRREEADKHGQFYTGSEYNLTPLLTSGNTLLELGRSCVLAEYRTRPVMQILWQWLAHYMMDYNIDLMFGCASFNSTNLEDIAMPLAYLYHYHQAPSDLCPRAVDDLYIDMNTCPKEKIDPKTVFKMLPPLIKGYIRLGAKIGNGAVLDHQFNTTDVCIVLQTHLLSDRYLKHYSRRKANDPDDKQAQAGTSS